MDIRAAAEARNNALGSTRAEPGRMWRPPMNQPQRPQTRLYRTPKETAYRDKPSKPRGARELTEVGPPRQL